jgi:hypothetical protein
MIAIIARTIIAFNLIELDDKNYLLSADFPETFMAIIILWRICTMQNTPLPHGDVTGDTTVTTQR